MTGIYTIKNVKNGKLYIGSSEDLKRRFADHKYLLNKGIHHSIHLQRSWNKNGSDCFRFEIIEECEEKEIVFREQYWLNELLKAEDYYNGDSKYFIENGYNILPKSSKGFSGKKSRDSILKQLKNSNRYKEIYQISDDGKILNIFEIKKDCPDIRHVVSKSIKDGKMPLKRKYGYIYKDDYKKGWKPKEQISSRKGIKNTWTPGREVYVYDIYNRFFKIFKSLKECAIFFKKDTSAINALLNKKPKKIQNPYNFHYEKQILELDILTFKNIKDDFEVYTLFDEFLGYSNYIELSEKLQTTNQCIRAVINGSRKQLKGYKIKKYKDIV